MKPRDLAIVGAVVVIAGFAAADAIRGTGESSPPPTAPTSTRDDTSEPGARETFPDVPARGAVAFTTADECRLRDVSVSTGIEFPLPRIETRCGLWAAARGDRLAYAITGVVENAVGFRFIDLGRPLQELGGSRALFGEILWSQDGQRAAWCNGVSGGFDLELGRERRAVPFCPRAFTPTGRLAHARDGELFVEGEKVLTASGRIDSLSYGADGSVALVVDGVRFQRWKDGRLVHEEMLPRAFAGQVPVLSPDNCAGLFFRGPRAYLVDLGCFRGRESFTNVSPDNCLNRREVDISRCARFPAPRSFPGTAAAWSPDGEWIVAADADGIVFHRVVGQYETVQWDAAARDIAWH